LKLILTEDTSLLGGSVKASPLKLCLPVIILSTQYAVVTFIIPPFLESLKYPLSAIGSLISVGPILALCARLPAGLIYKGERARSLLVGTLLIIVISNFLYGFAVKPLYFALVHAVNGFALGAATTIYLAFYVESLPAGENRHHAMGYYVGALAAGYSSGSFMGGFVGDRFGHIATFDFGALLALSCFPILFYLKWRPASPGKRELQERRSPGVFDSLKNTLDPKIAAVMVVALFLNVIHQMGSVFLPLYGLAVGLSLTQIGVIKGLYALCNAITRPLSGLVVQRLSSRFLSPTLLPLQALSMTLIPFFDHFSSLLVIYVLGGFLRAIGIVSNTISMVEDVDERRVRRGIASGVFNAAGDIGNILGPSLGGLIASFVGVAGLFLTGPPIIAGLFLISLWGCRFIKEF
jgi:DHA1 family multidrug resistance protein-like MFS transporter